MDENWAEDSEWAVEPTLSELIEACGDDFGILERYAPTSWRAFNRSQNINGIAKTHETAVAKLWLALNPKKV